MKKSEHYHFIGIGGAGMSAIAQIMHEQGYSVSGSDQKGSHVTERLRGMGVKVDIGHAAANVNGATLVIYSAAIPQENPEMVRAREQGIETICRAEMLGRLMRRFEHRVAVTGTHGKTTTTSMVSLVLQEAGLDPTVLVGGDVEILGGNAKLGRGHVVVAEACEAFNSFLYLDPSVAVITNVDADHLDFHGTFDNVKESFRKFIDRVDKDGCVIACMDDPGVKEVLTGCPVEVVGYSTLRCADLEARSIRVDSPRARYMLVKDGEELGEVELGVTGRQFVANSLAAAAVGFRLGASFDNVRLALGKYEGTGRRLEKLGTVDDVTVIDDYAHHPKEIEVTLTAVRDSQPGRRIVAVFQPHLYSRTQFFCSDFAQVLSLADYVIVTGIYAAREKPIPGVTAESIVQIVRERGTPVEYIEDKDRVPGFLKPYIKPGDTVLTLGAGDIRLVGERLLEELAKSEE